MAKFYKNLESNKVFCVLGGAPDFTDSNIAPLKENSVDASKEKHVPIVQEEDGKVLVKIGSEDHPMDESHYIEWVCIVTDRGFQIKYLKPSSVPGCLFLTDPSEIVLEVYAYCNIHGLWKSSN